MLAYEGMLRWLSVVLVFIQSLSLGSNDSEAEEPAGQNSWQSIECDQVVCGNCSAKFPLADTLSFIKHKQESCGAVISPENNRLLNDSAALEISGEALKAHGNISVSSYKLRHMLRAMPTQFLFKGVQGFITNHTT